MGKWGCYENYESIGVKFLLFQVHAQSMVVADNMIKKKKKVIIIVVETEK